MAVIPRWTAIFAFSPNSSGVFAPANPPVYVNPDFVIDPAAQQLINRYAQMFAQNVP